MKVELAICSVAVVHAGLAVNVAAELVGPAAVGVNGRSRQSKQQGKYRFLCGDKQGDRRAYDKPYNGCDLCPIAQHGGN